MSTAHLVFAGALLCVSAASLAQSQPATPSTSPRATTAGEAKSGAPAAATGTDTSGNKSFFESRSNTARTPGDAKAVTPGSDASAKKTFNESRSNNTRAPADAKAVNPVTTSLPLAAPAPSAPK